MEAGLGVEPVDLSWRGHRSPSKRQGDALYHHPSPSLVKGKESQSPTWKAATKKLPSWLYCPMYALEVTASMRRCKQQIEQPAVAQRKHMSSPRGSPRSHSGTPPPFYPHLPHPYAITAAQEHDPLLPSLCPALPSLHLGVQRQ